MSVVDTRAFMVELAVLDAFGDRCRKPQQVADAVTHLAADLGAADRGTVAAAINRGLSTCDTGGQHDIWAPALWALSAPVAASTDGTVTADQHAVIIGAARYALTGGAGEARTDVAEELTRVADDLVVTVRSEIVHMIHSGLRYRLPDDSADLWRSTIEALRNVNRHD